MLGIVSFLKCVRFLGVSWISVEELGKKKIKYKCNLYFFFLYSLYFIEMLKESKYWGICR